MVSLWICMHRNTFNSFQFLEQKKFLELLKLPVSRRSLDVASNLSPCKKNNPHSYCSLCFLRIKARRLQLTGRGKLRSHQAQRWSRDDACSLISCKHPSFSPLWNSSASLYSQDQGTQSTWQKWMRTWFPPGYGISGATLQAWDFKKHFGQMR